MISRACGNRDPKIFGKTMLSRMVIDLQGSKFQGIFKDF